LTDVFRLNLPRIFLAGFVPVEISRYGARHDRRHFDAVFAKVEHDRLRKPNQAKLTGVVGRTLFEEVSTGQTSDRDEVPLRLGQFRYSRFGGIKDTRQVDVDRFLPLLRRQFLNGRKMTDTSVGNNIVELTPLCNQRVDGFLLRR